MVIVNRMIGHYGAIYTRDSLQPDYDAPNLFVSGPPGAGKTHMVKSLVDISDIMKVGDVVRGAYMGIAGVNVGGSSLCSLMDIPIGQSGKEQLLRPWRAEKLDDFKRMYDVRKISCFVIDEISTTMAYILANVHQRLMEATGVKKLFGGVAMLLVGDYDQMPPAVGESIPATVMKLERSKMWRGRFGHANRDLVTGASAAGARIFKMAEHIKLSTQHRSIDERQTALINKMREEQKVTKEDLREMYPLLGEGPDGDKAFQHATVIVTGNYERRLINDCQSERFARCNNTVIVRWPRKLKDWMGGPTTAAGVQHAIDNNACFWETFLCNALGYLNVNVNTKIEMANGTLVRYHSLSFLKEADLAIFNRMVNGARAGDTVTLNDPPDIINVELFPDVEGQSDDELKKNRESRQKWKWGTVPNSDGKIIVPVSRHNSRCIKKMSELVRPSARPVRYSPSRAYLQDHFPLELGFAITIYKVQGRTIYKIIVALSKHPEEKLRFIFEGVYTALSRIRKSEDMRLLLTNKDWNTLDYIASLEKDPEITQFFKGYPDSPNTFVRWDPGLAGVGASPENNS